MPRSSALTLSVLALLALTILPAPTRGAPYVICVDPGHGGSDPGAVGCGLEEEDVTLDVSLRLQALLQADPELSPILTRTSDTSVSLSSRAAYANDHGADRFASIHCNAYDGTASGIETYCYTYGSAASFDQRDRIQAHMLATWPALPDRGGKTAGFFVIKNTSMPATLSELAFIDHCAPDAQYLADPNERQAAAEAHHAALRASLGLGGTTPPPTTDGILRGVIFEDQGVGSSDMSIRIPGALIAAVGADGVSYSTASDVPTASWAVSVPASSYEVTASAAGYQPRSRSCAVTASGETWCSIGLLPQEVTPPDQTGSAIGVVYVDDGSGGMDQGLPGAAVSVNGPGGSFSTSAASPDAMWMFDLAPGAYTVHASHPGYYDATRSCWVTAGEVSWCSIGLSPEPDTPPPAGKGRLMGYVYENTGAGADDMSIKLVGAVVVAMASNGQQALTSTTATAPLWQLDLAEGVYTVTASRLGYQDKSRACVVTAGQDGWCSIGLLPSTGAPPDTTQPDTTTPPDTGSPTTPDPAADTTGPPDSAAPPDSWTSPSGNPDGAGPSAPGEDWMGAGLDLAGATGYTPGQGNAVRGGEGCAIGDEGGSMAVALMSLLLLLLVMMRARKPLGPLLLISLALTGPATAQEALSLSEIRAVTAAHDFSQPVWAPDGAHLALAGPGFASLFVTRARGGEPVQVAQGRQSGYEPVWAPDGQSITWRAPGQRRADVPLMAVTLDGRAAPPPANPTPGRWLTLDAEQQVWLRIGRSAARLSEPGDRYFGAALSPGGAYAVFQGLARGLFVHELASGRTWALGTGTQPRFDAGGRRLAFERCEDDGRELTGCELAVAALGRGAPRVLIIEGAPPLARHPALSPDGAWLAFELDGAVFVGRLRAP